MRKTDLPALLRCTVLAAAVALGATAAQAQYDTDSIGGYDANGDSGHPQPHERGRAFPDPSTGIAARVQRTEGGRYEWIVIGPIGQADAVRAAIEGVGGQIIRTSQQDALGQTTQIAFFLSEEDRRAAEEAIARLAPESSLSWHHLYSFAQAAGSTPRLYAPALIGEAEPGRCRLASPVSIGMIDGPINTEHPALRGVDVTYETVVPRGLVPQADHGTAVAVLMVGEDPSGALAGFARGARLHAISVFAQTDLEEEASVERIAEAIDRLVGHGVQLINLSLAGPENAALGRAVSAAAARGVVLVAASGNERRPVVAWPAAAPEVIAVTAVDASRRRFRMANTGTEIEFAAPGVDIYAARSRGAGYVSGTSFAAPIVTALAARQMAQGAGSLSAVRAALRASVETLGPGSRNTDFGWGLVRSGGC